jgi:hypothetical protein
MSTSGTLVFVGVDVCARTNVLASAGYGLRCCECETNDLREALSRGPVDAVLFQCVPEPPSRVLLATARALTNAPVILFADESSNYNESEFDMVLSGLCSPNEWLPPIAEALAAHRNPERRKPPQPHAIDAPRKERRYKSIR